MRKAITLATHGNSSRITIPRPLLRYLKWHENEELMVTVSSDGGFHAIPVETYIVQRHEQLKREERDAAARQANT